MHSKKLLITLLITCPTLLVACGAKISPTEYVCRQVQGDILQAAIEVNTAPQDLPYTEELILNVNRHNCACRSLENKTEPEDECGIIP